MGLWKWLTTGGETVDKITDAVINTGDALVFTEEERAEFSEKKRELWWKFMQMARDESSIRSVTRRLLALLVFAHWFLFMDVALVCYLLDRDDAAKAIATMAVDMYWIVFAVASFYFGAHLLGRYREGKKEKPDG